MPPPATPSDKMTWQHLAPRAISAAFAPHTPAFANRIAIATHSATSSLGQFLDHSCALRTAPAPEAWSAPRDIVHVARMPGAAGSLRCSPIKSLFANAAAASAPDPPPTASNCTSPSSSVNTMPRGRIASVNSCFPAPTSLSKELHLAMSACAYVKESSPISALSTSFAISGRYTYPSESPQRLDRTIVAQGFDPSLGPF
mmetsp:Transcript_855/g.3561  ORF Transcript_855/g.3561 Transcript_855/m.3561 type:complete len:200 (+) Transcript_855:421-1020(+)